MAAPPDAYTVACRADLAEARKSLDTIRSAKSRSAETVLVPYDRVLTVLDRWGGRSGVYAEVHPDAKMRQAAETCVKDTSALAAEIKLDRRIYDALAAVPPSPENDTKRFLERTLRDFRRAGVDKDDATRARLQALSDEMTALQLELGKNIREDVHRVKLAPADLVGLPADYLASHHPGTDGMVEITTDYPDYFPVQTYASKEDTRRKLAVEFLNRGYPKNTEVLTKLLAARKETASLLGYRDWADYITEDKMVESAAKAQSFIDKISDVAGPRMKVDLAAVLERKRKDDPKAARVEAWDRYHDTVLKKERYGYDPQEMRPYFEFGATRDGLLAVTGKLFGIEYRKVTDAEIWQESVDVYDVFEGDEKLGRIYLDLHPRENKYKHAAQFTLVSGVAGKQLPEGVLVCNFPDPSTGPAYMDHDEVVTLFHEFGHLLHHVFAGKQRWIYFSGVATEFDFVEAPSQMLEEWARDPEVLALFARHKDSKQAIPAALVAKMRAAVDFGKGIQARQQMFYAALSLQMHLNDPKSLDLEKLTVDIQQKYSPVPTVPGTHFWAGFGHLGDYSAMYYTYMWSLVIAKDLFSPFDQKGLFDLATARRYRDAVLKPGGSRPAADMVKDFLGRPYSFDAYQKWLNR